MRGVIGVLFYSVIALAPILAGVFIASRLLLDPRAPHRSRRSGGRHRVLGGAVVPAQWAGSFWTTVEAAGNAAKYGHSFQHAAEHVPFLLPLLCPAGWNRVRGRWVNHLEASLRSPFCAAPFVESAARCSTLPRKKSATLVVDLNPFVHHLCS